MQKNGCSQTLPTPEFHCFGSFRRTKAHVSQSGRVCYLINISVCYLISTDVTVLSSNYSPDLEHLTIRCCPFNLPPELCCIYNADYKSTRILILRLFLMTAGDLQLVIQTRALQKYYPPLPVSHMVMKLCTIALNYIQGTVVHFGMAMCLSFVWLYTTSSIMQTRHWTVYVCLSWLT